MAWNYSGDPADSDRDAVRFRITDTDSTDQLVTDEEIAYALNLKGDVGGAAIFLARQIALAFSRLASAVQRGQLREEYEERGGMFRDLSEQLAAEAGDAPGAVAGIWAGSTLRSEVEAADGDTSRTRGAFAIGMFDWPASKDENEVSS